MENCTQSPVQFIFAIKVAILGGIMEKKLLYLVARLTIVLCLIFIISPAVFPQTIDGYFKTKLNCNEVKLLLDTLRSEEDFVQIQRRFFDLAGGDDGVYNPHLKNLVFFIDEAHSNSKDKYKINIKLIIREKEKKQLFGERYVYAMVFVAKNSLRPISLSAKYSSLEWRRPSGDFFLVSIVKAIASALGEISLEKQEEEKKGKDPIDLNMDKLGCSGSTCLFLGIAEIPLKVNTVNRIRIIGFDDIGPQATFGNYSRSCITSSIGMMWTRFKSKTDNEEEIQNLFDPFAYAHFYIKRPQLPIPQYSINKCFRNLWRRTSISLVVGTKIEETLLNEVFIGASIGNLFLNSVGIVVGCNFRKVNGIEKRKGSFALGLTFIF